MTTENVKTLLEDDLLAEKMERVRMILYVGFEYNENNEITGTHTIVEPTTEYLLTDLEGCVIEANLLADKNGKIGALLQVAIECDDNEDRFSTKDILATVTEFTLANLK